ncbi:MAG: Uma2 family endonuclease [Candidatus Eremiobacteraeota bacterium]|nr:Uma2 family endonuclease [Candidatus Eremiobacteraeota bacterium]
MSEAMQTVRRIPRSLDFPDTEKPYVESIRGRLERKVSPKTRHSILQGRLWGVLNSWGASRGSIGTEWRFYLLTDRAKPSSLVPDVAYVSHERLPRDFPEDARERPRIAPDIAVEIVSPRDCLRSLEEKVAIYLSHGCGAVVIVWPERHAVELRYSEGRRGEASSGLVSVDGFQGLTIDVDSLFTDL